MTQKIIKTGNSAAVTIPSEVMQSLNLRIGDVARATMDFERGAITFIFPEVRQLRLGRGKKDLREKE